MNVSRQQVKAQEELIMNLINEGYKDQEIIDKLNIPRTTYYHYKKRLQKEIAKKWDKVILDSAKFRAVQLIDSFEECYTFNKAVMENENVDWKTRIEASKIMCEANANIFKIVNEGLSVKPTMNPKRYLELPKTAITYSEYGQEVET